MNRLQPELYRDLELSPPALSGAGPERQWLYVASNIDGMLPVSRQYVDQMHREIMSQLGEMERMMQQQALSKSPPTLAPRVSTPADEPSEGEFAAVALEHMRWVRRELSEARRAISSVLRRMEEREKGLLGG